MAKVELIMPKMGESIMEATILKWLKQEGDEVEVDETILEIATDKVDSEVPSPVSGTIEKILFAVDDTVDIGQVIAVINTNAEEPAAVATGSGDAPSSASGQSNGANEPQPVQEAPVPVSAEASVATIGKPSESNRFYSPLVRNIAQKEQISAAELETIPGTGLHGRVTKKDILGYIESRPSTQAQHPPQKSAPINTFAAAANGSSVSGNVEIIEMDRMRKLIADHMVHSKHTSPHVTSFVEVDVTNIVNWRNKVKLSFQEKYGEKITYTPIFIEAITKALADFPLVNVSVDGSRIIRKKDINIGMATALPSGNLIVPVIKNADRLSLIGLTQAVNDLAARARSNQLKPHEIQDGTFTVTNVGTFGNVMGTPIINQPQAAIMAVGAIRKKPAVVETEYGDLIAVRQMMFLSLSYDHRVVDGFLGGSFLRKVGDYLEQFAAPNV